MLEEGASFIDIGGASSRPGSDPVSPKEEIKRVIPAISTILKNFPKAQFQSTPSLARLLKKLLNLGL